MRFYEFTFTDETKVAHFQHQIIEAIFPLVPTRFDLHDMPQLNSDRLVVCYNRKPPNVGCRHHSNQA